MYPLYARLRKTEKPKILLNYEPRFYFNKNIKYRYSKRKRLENTMKKVCFDIRLHVYNNMPSLACNFLITSELYRFSNDFVDWTFNML